MKKGINFCKIKALYEEGKTPVEISEILDCNICNITRRLKKGGIEVKRDYTKTRNRRTNKYKVDTSYFDFIDTEYKAYFLGLMYSDGSVSKNSFYLKLTDEDVLQKFKTELKYEGPIKYIHTQNVNWRDFYKLTVNSQEMVKSLISKGCTPNKTRTLTFPSLPDNLIKHFIRGFFDGDGCLQLQDKLYHCRIDFTCASKIFLEQLRPIISKISITNGYLGKETNYEVWHLNYSGKQVIQILNWLYEDSHVYIKRKHDKYLLLGSFKIG